MNSGDAFAEGLRRLVAHYPYLRLDLDWATAIPLVACLQLALRHPGNTGHPARVARQFVDDLIEKVAGVEPDLAALLRLGDDPQHDQPR